MKKILFKDLHIGQAFIYEDEPYFKTEKNRAMGFMGGKEFNLETEVIL